MAYQQQYVSLQDMKAYLGIADTDTTQDAFFNMIIPKVMAFVDNYTNRSFGWGNSEDLSDLTEYNPVTETYDGAWGDSIWLKNCDVVAVDSVSIGDPTIGTPQSLQTTDYLWRKDGRLLLGGSSFSSSVNSSWFGDGRNSFTASRAAGYQTIEVTYRYGYAGVPPDISMACMDLCSALNVVRKSQGLTSERLGDYQINYASSFQGTLAKQPDTLGALKRYRMVRM